MIFVTLGTQQIPFFRLLEEVDNLIEENCIQEEVFAQIGYTPYTPKHFKCIDFLPEEEYNRYIKNARFIITHAGSGALFNVIKRGKKGISVARLKKYGEMMDDHQLELTKKLSEEGYILDGSRSLKEAVGKIDTFMPRPCDFEQHISEAIRKYISSLSFKK
ncbi:MAG: glycosyl transferase family 28 [Porphyromonadaceae bacterium]|nr:glycosyl transferase family 28 [Porphyromonadaceae bacterium]